MLKQVAFLFVALFINHTFTAFMRNKYVVEVEKVEPCPNNAQIGYPIRNLKLLRYNRTHKTLSYDFTYAEDLDENVGGSVVVERWGGGGWITIPFMGFQPNMCHRALQYFKSLWVNFHKIVGVRHPDRCPVPAGNYTVKNYVVDATEISVPFWSGRFRFTTTFQLVDTKRVIYCCIYIIKITEVF